MEDAQRERIMERKRGRESLRLIIPSFFFIFSFFYFSAGQRGYRGEQNKVQVYITGNVAIVGRGGGFFLFRTVYTSFIFILTFDECG